MRFNFSILIYRGKSYDKKALVALGGKVKVDTIESIHNKKAHALYQKQGFLVEKDYT